MANITENSYQISDVMLRGYGVIKLIYFMTGHMIFLPNCVLCHAFLVMLPNKITRKFLYTLIPAGCRLYKTQPLLQLVPGALSRVSKTYISSEGHNGKFSASEVHYQC